MKTPANLSRRQFIGLAAGSATVLATDAFCIEPSLIKTRFVSLAQGEPTTHRLVQFSDTHHKGDRAYLASAVEQINGLSPDFVCFTGDLIEHNEHLPEALDIIKGIDAPVYGVPGNHDYISHADFRVINQAFATTGGRWLLNEKVSIGGKINLMGAVCDNAKFCQPIAGMKNIVLMHYPEFVDKLADKKFDLMLAGHSHGGQIRLPVFGAVILPKGVGKYDLGMFHTQAGPLYVNPGLGCLYVDIRFNCRPEITVFEV